MALIRFAEGQQRSGSIGGTVYSHNRFGAYIRARSIPVNPNTTYQAAVRNWMRNLAIAWQNDLTDDQRRSWTQYALGTIWLNKFGESTHLSGLNHFIRSNVANFQAGGTRISEGPDVFTLAQAEASLVVGASEATQELNIQFDDSADWCAEDGAFELVFMGRPRNPSNDYFGGPYRFAGTIDGSSTTAPTTPVQIAAPFVFAAGQRIWVQTRILRADGRLSLRAQDDFLAAA